MRELIQVLKAVADKNRLRIIKMLEQKKMCVCELSAVLEITQPSVSKHLSILNNAGILKDERNGQWIDYSLNDERINLYWRAFLLYLMMEFLEAQNDDLFRLYRDMFVDTIKAKND